MSDFNDFKEFRIADHLRTPAEVAAYLEAALTYDDGLPEAVAHAIEALRQIDAREAKTRECP